MAINLGRLGFVIKGAFKQNTSYKRLDVVSDSEDNVYASLVDNNTSPLSDTNKWYKMLPSPTHDVIPVANAVSEGVIFIETDDTNWKSNRTLMPNNISGHREILVIPENIDLGETAKTLIFKLKHNCAYLTLNRSSYATALQDYDGIVPGDDVFMENDVWALSIRYIASNDANTSSILNYTLTRLYREPKIVNCEAFITTEINVSTSSASEKRITIHPMGELGKLKKNITYQFKCHCINYGINFWKHIKDKNGNTVTNMTGEEFKLNIPLRIIPSYFDSMIRDKNAGDFSNWKVSTNSIDQTFEYGRLDLPAGIPIRFPQLYKQDGYGSLLKLNVPINETFTIILAPNFRIRDGVYDVENINSCPWSALVYFDNIQNIISVSNEANVVPEDNDYIEPPADENYATFDCNGDGKVDVEDVNILINVILKLNAFTHDRSLNHTLDGSGRRLVYIPSDKYDDMLAAANTSVFDVSVVNAAINIILRLNGTTGSDLVENPEDVPSIIITPPDDPAEDPTIEVLPRFNANHLIIGDLDLSGTVSPNDYSIALLYKEALSYTVTVKDSNQTSLSGAEVDLDGDVDYYCIQYMEDHNMSYGEFEEFILSMPGTVNATNYSEYVRILGSLFSILADVNCDGFITEKDTNAIAAYIDAVSSGQTPPVSNVGKRLNLILGDNSNNSDSFSPLSNVIDGAVAFNPDASVMNGLSEKDYQKSNKTIAQAIKTAR